MFYSGQKQIFLLFFLRIFLHVFFNATRKKLVTLDFYFFMKLSKEKEHMELNPYTLWLLELYFIFNSTNLNLYPVLVSIYSHINQMKYK